MPILTLKSIKDSYVSELSTEKALNYGTSDVIKYGSQNANDDIMFVVQFDVSQVPKAAIINSAILKFYIAAVSGAQTLINQMVQPFTAEWDEYTISYNNMPSRNGAYHILDSQILDASDSGTYLELEIQNIVIGWKDGSIPNNGIYGYNNKDGTGDIVLSLASREYADTTKIPQLVINYTIPAPSAPTNLSPANGFAINVAEALKLSWQHNPAVPGAQSKFNLQWRQQGTSTWNTITLATADQFNSFVANTFPRGYVEWQVRTYDTNNQVSPWSAIALFYVVQKPPIPVITAPANNAELTTPTPTVTWTSTEQVDYNLQVVDSNNVLAWEIVNTSQDKTKQIEYALENNATYKLRARIKNADNYWSDFAEVTVTTKYVDPPAPTVATTQDKERGSIILDIANDEANMPSKVKVGLTGKLVADGINPEKVVVNPVIKSTSADLSREASISVPCTLRECRGVRDEITQDGKLIQKIKYKVLDGSLNWSYQPLARTGFKAVWTNAIFGDWKGQDTSLVLKYNSKMLKFDGTANTIDGFIDYWASTGNPAQLSIAISNTDSGWGDAYTPTADEIKAYFNGWVMSGTDGVLYTAGTKYWSKKYCGVGTLATFPTGTTVISGSGVTTVPIIINDQGYSPYRLYYQLATPSETTISPVEIAYFPGGTVQAIAEVVPEITVSAPVPAYYQNEVYRRKQGEANWIRIGKALVGNTPFTDYTPAHNQNYEYKVRTILETKAYAESAIITAYAILRNSQIALVSDYSQWIELKHNPSKTRSKTYSRALVHFAGRKYPVAEFTEQEEDNLAVGFTVYKEALDKLFEITDKMQTILFRDSRDKCVFGTIGAIETEDDIIFSYYIVRFAIDRVDYIEGV